MPDVPAEVEAIGAFLGTIGGVIATIVTVYVRIERALRERRERAVDEPDTRRMPALPAEDEPQQAAFWRQRANHALEQLSIERQAHHEAAKLAEARERALERAKRELQADLDAVRGDLVVANRRAQVAEQQGVELARQWRAAQELDSDAPPANPRSSGAITVPPRKL